MADETKRMFLWGTSRSMSTAITKCLSYVDGIQIVNQVYASTHFSGPEADLPTPNPNDKVVSQILEVYNNTKKEATNCKAGLDHTKMTYTWIRDEVLEAPYPNKKILLCRDQAHYLHGRYEMLPQGFKHSFLIRHPAKVFRSYKRHLTECFGDFPDMRAFPSMQFPPGYGFKELYDLVQYVKENIDPQPVIVDADDLLEDPAGILSTYCARMGIPYSDKLLSWEPGSGITSTWIMADNVLVANTMQEFYKHAFESRGFDKPTPIPDFESLSHDVRACVQFSMVYYESMYRERIRTNSHA